MNGLEIQPEFRAGIESLCEQPRGLRRDTSLCPDDLIDALGRHTDVSGEGDLGDFKWMEKLPLEYLARMSRDSVFR